MVREKGKKSHFWGLRFDEKNAASFAGNACLSPVGGGGYPLWLEGALG